MDYQLALAEAASPVARGSKQGVCLTDQVGRPFLLLSDWVSKSLAHTPQAHTDCMRTVLADAVLHNPVIKHFQTPRETTDFLAEFPILYLTL